MKNLNKKKFSDLLPALKSEDSRHLSELSYPRVIERFKDPSYKFMTTAKDK